MYQLKTPGIVQFACRHISKIGGAAVLPVRTYVAAPFWILCVPTKYGDMPMDANSYHHSGAWTMPRNIVLNCSYCDWPSNKLHCPAKNTGFDSRCQTKIGKRKSQDAPCLSTHARAGPSF